MPSIQLMQCAKGIYQTTEDSICKTPPPGSSIGHIFRRYAGDVPDERSARDTPPTDNIASRVLGFCDQPRKMQAEAILNNSIPGLSD